MAKKKPIVSSLGQWAYPGEVTIIPSSNITMKGVNYPVLGVDDLGNSQMMMPGQNYTFPGEYVTEYPQMQFGGMSKRKIDKILNQNKDLNFVQRLYQSNTPSIVIPGQQYPSTHFMESADGRVYPTVVQMPDGSLQYLADNAYDYANQTGEYIQFPNDRQARRFAKSYKKGTGVLEEFGKGGLRQWFAEEWTDVKTGKPCGRSGDEKGSRPYPACRPKKRVNETTPKTTSEMSSAEKARFKREKTSGKRIDYNHKRREDGGETWLDQYQDAGEIPSNIERMEGVDIHKKRSWFDKLKGVVHRGERAIGLDPYNERSDDFFEQWARRINTATGGKDWYKQPNDGSGAGGLPTAMMETIMAPFSAPQLASVYGVTGKVQMPSEAMNIQNPVGAFVTDAVLDPTNLVGVGMAKNLGKGSLQNMVRSRMSGVRPSIQNSVDNIVIPNISQNVSVSPVGWQAQELPGLHLKSTMTEGPISKIVEPKTGLVNVEQALGIIGKESGGADKVALIKQGLGENIPKKMDYNDFRKTVQDQLIPLERQFSTERSDYGIDRLGYTPGKFVTKEVDGKKIHTYESDYLDNQTILFSNKDKFGRGSGAHGNPDETLGHAHYLIDKESPDVLTVTQIQSDAFQGTHRIMPKNAPDASKAKQSLQRMEELQNRNKSILHKMKTEGVDEAGVPVQDYKIKQFEDIVKGQEQSNLFKKAEIENFTQKQLLDKNHQERYLQELVDYAGKQDYLNKVRVPTSETAAKVQGYSKNTASGMDEMGFPTELGYSPEHQTILKKYSEQPKTIKKLFGEEPKIVTDSKGNTWYEFDIPKKFKEGKGEIKAFSTIGGIGVAGAAASQLPEQKNGGWLNKYK